MDLSSLPESQQLQELQQKFQEHQAERQLEQEHQQLQIQQQQQHIQPYASNVTYDAQPVQSYDPNHAYYYQYAQHQPQYAYNQSGCANAYHQSTIAPVQHQPAEPVQPEPGLPVQSVAVAEQGGGALQITEGQNEFYEQGQGSATAAAYQGLNPAAAAAVAALSQLAQFAGTMSDAERVMSGERFGQIVGAVEPFFGQNIQVGQPSYRASGGRRDGGPFRDRNRGHRGSAHFRGRGRGRGRSGHSLKSLVNDADSIVEGEEPSAAPVDELGKGTLPSRSTESEKARRPHAIWYCELCCAECNSAEILEQHNNGKKHQKNLQKADKLKISYKPRSGISEQNPIIGSHQEMTQQSGNGQVPGNLPSQISTGENEKNVKIEQNSDSVQQPQQSENAQVTGNLPFQISTAENEKNVKIEQNSDSVQQPQQSENAQVTGNLPSEISTAENEKNVKIEQNSDSVQQPQQSENAQVTGNSPFVISTTENEKNEQIEQNSDSVHVQQSAEGTSDLLVNNQLNQVNRGTKRKIRGGRGGKITRSFESLRRPKERPLPKVVIPLICDLCYVKCDTREVFDRHIAGKKHVSKVKRFEGHHAMYGPMVQALYPPNPMTQTLYNHPAHVQQPPPFHVTQNMYPYMYPQPNQVMRIPIHVNSVPMPESMVSYPPQNNTTVGNEQVNVRTSVGHA